MKPSQILDRLLERQKPIVEIGYRFSIAIKHGILVSSGISTTEVDQCQNK